MSTPRPLPALHGGPEDAFRLGTIAQDGTRTTGSMPVGPWLAGRDGRTAAGALGVLVDDVLGYALIATRPDGRWSVSAEITLDVLGPLPTSGELTAVAEVDHVDALGAYATGHLVDDHDRVVARSTQRGRFVPLSGADPAPSAYERVAGSGDVVAWLDRAYADGAPFVVPDVLANPLGNVHGGISLCLSDLIARRAVAARLTTASLHLAYTRAIPVGATLAYAAAVRHAGRGLAVVDVTGHLDGSDQRPATLARVVLHPHADR